MKKTILSIFIGLALFILVACSTKTGNYDQYNYPNGSNDEFSEITENPFIKTADSDKSNISLSANTASYSMIRGYINNNQVIDKDMVRIEEMVNFFNYNYQNPASGKLFGMTSEIFKTPWNDETNLLLVGLQTEKKDLGNVPNNLVLLLDVSGSMSSSNKLPLVKQSMKLLIDQMRQGDTVSVVTYSSGEKVVVDGGKFNDKANIIEEINALKASGSTAGKKGLQMAYQVAEQHFIENGNNRIILATDGDFNVGISDTNRLVEYISEKRDTGIYFSAFGFGYGNLKDEKLENLAKSGNGTHYYIDDLLSAEKAFVDDINGLLFTIARDAKAQITFNKEIISEYRLIGYENRMLSDYEYEDDTTDAGEIGSGLQVTAIYEVKLTDTVNENFGSLEIKYKDPNTKDDINKTENFILDYSVFKTTPSNDSLFISAVVEFGLILRNSAYKGNATISLLLERISNLEEIKTDKYKKDFKELVDKYYRYNNEQ